MSQENVEVVRQPVAVRAQSRPSLEERLFSRFPRVFELLARAFGRFWRVLPPCSRMRRAIAGRYTGQQTRKAGGPIWKRLGSGRPQKPAA
jgi:hypothetical protein